MRIISNLKKLFLLCFITTAIISCNNDDTVSPQPIDNSIAGIASRDPQFTVLVSALTRAGLVNTLKGTGPFTVFAPTNTAFNAFLANSTPPYANVEAVPVAVLKELLLNHVLSGAVQSTELTTGYIKTLAKGSASATNTLSMFVNTASGVKLNGVSNVTTANKVATNGVMHTVDAIIGLPNLVTHATANPNFSSLTGIVNSAPQAAVKTALLGTGPLTVFAPTNAAFTALNIELAPGGTAGVSNANITKVLQYHVVSGNLLAANLTAGSISTVLGQNFTLALTPAAQITDIRSRVSGVTPADVQCTNGVIHVLNKVLLPNF